MNQVIQSATIRRKITKKVARLLAFFWRCLVEAKAGLLYYFAVFVFCTLQNGGSSPAATADNSLTQATQAFSNNTWQIHLKILATYLAIGGAQGWLIFHFWGTLFPEKTVIKSHRIIRALYHLATLFAIHVFLLVRHLVIYPQVYAPALFQQGGWKRTLQMQLTEYLPLGFFTFSGAAFLIAGAGMILYLRAKQWQQWIADRPTRQKLRIAGAACAVLIVMGIGWKKTHPSKAPHDPARPNLVFISISSLRLDRLGVSDYFRVVMPETDKLGEKGTVFTNLRTPLARTSPSIVSQLTGQYPTQHNVRHMFTRMEDVPRPLNTLPRILTGQGYQSAVFADFAGEVFSRVDLGFDQTSAPMSSLSNLVELQILGSHFPLRPYLSNTWGRSLFPALRSDPSQPDPSLLTDEAEDWLRTNTAQGPFALMIFYSAAHAPHAAPYPHYQSYDESGYQGGMKYCKSCQGPTQTLSSADIRQARGLYDGALGAVDDQVGRILNILEDLDVRDNTIVAISADHGNYLYEQDHHAGHGDHLKGSHANRIPLIVYDPMGRLGKGVFRSLAGAIDLAPTLLEVMAQPPLQNIPGHSLVNMSFGQDPGRERVFMETGIWMDASPSPLLQKERLLYATLPSLVTFDEDAPHAVVLKWDKTDLVEIAKHRAIETPSDKLVYIPLRNGIKLHYYDLLEDLGETQDVARFHPDRVKKLLKQLTEHLVSEGMTIQQGFFLPNEIDELTKDTPNP